jgi:hypothetical protein
MPRETFQLPHAATPNTTAATPTGAPGIRQAHNAIPTTTNNPAKNSGRPPPAVLADNTHMAAKSGATIHRPFPFPHPTSPCRQGNQSARRHPTHGGPHLHQPRRSRHQRGPPKKGAQHMAHRFLAVHPQHPPQRQQPAHFQRPMKIRPRKRQPRPNPQRQHPRHHERHRHQPTVHLPTPEQDRHPHDPRPEPLSHAHLRRRRSSHPASGTPEHPVAWE